MAVTVTMPQLGESVTEGTLARWLKQPGEPVAKYESIAEVESDKVNAEIPSPSEGTMGELIAAEGAVVAVGESICTIEGAGEERSPEPSPGHPAKTESAPPQAAAVDESDSPPARRASPSQVLEREQRTVEAQESDQREGPGDGFHLTPAVRMLVREHKVDLSQITGTGLGGRITKKDVLEHVQRRQAASDGEEDTGRGAPPAS
ncbi:MAG TPA: biotin/lipoyl-containing protein, partial [Candidatus Sulfotelmatobacter sp.]|nr:biotin/lipoyl-containing protein [Candidatus Sulfotelmatobacter sp.]